MIDGHDQRDAAASVVADEVRALDAEMIHQAHDHGGLREQRAVEEVAPIGITVAEEIWRDDAGRLGEQRYHLVIEKRPGGNSVQEDDRRAVAKVGPSDAKRFVAQPVQLDRSLPLPESVMGERRRRATGRHDPSSSLFAEVSIALTSPRLPGTSGSACRSSSASSSRSSLAPPRWRRAARRCGR